MKAEKNFWLRGARTFWRTRLIPSPRSEVGQDRGRVEKETLDRLLLLMVLPCGAPEQRVPFIENRDGLYAY